MKRAVVLLSGGLDSAVTLYLVRSRGYRCHCLTFQYGQRHKREIASARSLASRAGSPLTVIAVQMPWKGSALTDRSKKIPGCTSTQVHKSTSKIPSTYVPGRNIIFLSYGLSFAEAIGAQALFIGVHAQDYSGYPDCRPEFISAFQAMATKGTKRGAEKDPIRIVAPLIGKTKAQIVSLGARLGVPFALTWSCYRGGKTPCGSCDSCRFRQKGFEEAGQQDG